MIKREDQLENDGFYICHDAVLTKIRSRATTEISF